MTFIKVRIIVLNKEIPSYGELAKRGGTTVSVLLQKLIVVLCNYILFYSRLNPSLDSLRLLVCCRAHIIGMENI